MDVSLLSENSNKATIQAYKTNVELEEATVENTVHSYRMALMGQEEAENSGLIPRICLFEDKNSRFCLMCKTTIMQ